LPVALKKSTNDQPPRVVSTRRQFCAISDLDPLFQVRLSLAVFDHILPLTGHRPSKTIMQISSKIKE
jgi:hypothetical protein